MKRVKPMPESQTLSQLAIHYQMLVDKLSQQKKLIPEQLLDCLLTRDQLAELTTTGHLSDEATIRLIAQSDKKLKKLAKPMDELDELNDWQVSLNRPIEAWWWYISPPPPPVELNVFERYDWIASTGNVILMTIIFALLADIAPRFWQGGADTTGTLAIVMQTVLTMITAGGVLTKTGADALERLFTNIGLPRYAWQEIRFGLALTVMLALLGFRVYGLPAVANGYHYLARSYHYEYHNLLQAKLYYERALALNSETGSRLESEIHYDLGRLYESLQDPAKARTEYQLAVIGNYPPAFNELAHLNIRQQNYKAAVNLLLEGLDKLRTDEVLLNDEARRVELLYQMQKNLGWARFQQGRYNQAIARLQEALSLKPDDAAAHCLMAQLLEAQDEAQGQPMGLDAWQHWEFCRQYTTRQTDPDADDWIYLAQQRSAPLTTTTSLTLTNGQLVTTTIPMTTTEIITTSVMTIDDSSTDLNLLVTANGVVKLKRQQWRDYFTVTIGAELRRGDQLQLADNAQATVLCHDLKSGPVPPGSVAGLANLCSLTDEPLLLRQQAVLTGVPLVTDSRQPYIIAPRASRVMTTRPWLRWQAVPGAISYTVILTGGEVAWQTTVTRTAITYPGQTPLQPGITYTLQVMTNRGRVSEPMSFSLLPAEAREQLEAEIATLGVTGAAKQLAMAQLYRSRHLLAEAVEILQPLATSEGPATGIHRLLGNLYLQMGLLPLAEESYQTAIRLAQEVGAIEGEAQARLGLAEVYHLWGWRPATREQWRQAQTRYQTLGDAGQVSELEVRLETSK